MSVCSLVYALALVGMVGHGAAKPFPKLEPRRLFNGQYNISSYHDMCVAPTYDASDPGGSREDIWYQTDAGRWLDLWLASNGEQDWVNRMDEFVSPDGLPNMLCDSAESPCPPPDSCRTYFDAGYTQAYYVFSAVSTVHTLLKSMHERLQDATIIQALEIPQMIEDFSVGEPDGQLGLLTSLAAGFTIGAGATALVAPELSAGLTVMVGIFSMAAQYQPTAVDPTLKLNDQLAQVFQASERQIETFLDWAFNGVDTNLLPLQTGDYNTHTAGFFGQGKFLLEDTDSYLDPFLEAGQAMMQHAMVNTLLQAEGYFVMVNTDVTEEDDCGSSDYGALWIDDQCFNMFRFESDDYTFCKDADDNITNMMVGKYQMDLAKVYTNAWECAMAFPDGDGHVDTAAVPWDGSLPTCFFNLPVVRGSFDARYDDVHDPDVNTSGREAHVRDDNYT